MATVSKNRFPFAAILLRLLNDDANQKRQKLPPARATGRAGTARNLRQVREVEEASQMFKTEGDSQ
jgi:hypothetical protein